MDRERVESFEEIFFRVDECVQLRLFQKMDSEISLKLQLEETEDLFESAESDSDLDETPVEQSKKKGSLWIISFISSLWFSFNSMIQWNNETCSLSEMNCSLCQL